MNRLTAHPAVDSLLPEDREKLEALCGQLDYIAELTSSDIFLDCPVSTDEQALVYAQARPGGGVSVYDHSIVGELALLDKEPAVFYCIKTGLPIRDLRATTQENRIVRQDAVPIRGSMGRVIAVLIREKDISADISREKKYLELARRREDSSAAALSASHIARLYERSVHHWIKNDLQLLASMMHMEARGTSREVQEALGSQRARLLAIAASHDAVSAYADADTPVPLRGLFESLCAGVMPLTPPDLSLEIHWLGDELTACPQQVPSLAIVLCELIVNAIKYAFLQRTKGRILVVGTAGLHFNHLQVEDNGVGFGPETGHGKGLRIVEMTVHDKLGGTFSICSGANGTTADLSYRTENSLL